MSEECWVLRAENNRLNPTRRWAGFPVGMCVQVNLWNLLVTKCLTFEEGNHVIEEVMVGARMDRKRWTTARAEWIHKLVAKPHLLVSHGTPLYLRYVAVFPPIKGVLADDIDVIEARLLDIEIPEPPLVDRELSHTPFPIFELSQIARVQ